MKFNELFEELMGENESMSEVEQEMHDKVIDILEELSARNPNALKKLMARIKEMGDILDYKPSKSVKTIKMSSDPRDASWVG